MASTAIITITKQKYIGLILYGDTPSYQQQQQQQMTTNYFRSFVIAIIIISEIIITKAYAVNQ